jgi:dihydrofolate reductase
MQKSSGTRIETIYYVASSLDGFIATPDGSVAWLAPFEGTGEDYGYADFYGSVDAVLMGRRTYGVTIGFSEWPFERKPVWVFSSRPLEPPRPGVVVTAARPESVLAELASRGVRRAWLVGGGELASAFRACHAITEYIVSLVPVLLGAGIPMIAASGSAERLELTGSRTYPNGIVQLRYRPEPSA